MPWNRSCIVPVQSAPDARTCFPTTGAASNSSMAVLQASRIESDRSATAAGALSDDRAGAGVGVSALFPHHRAVHRHQLDAGGVPHVAVAAAGNVADEVLAAAVDGVGVEQHEISGQSWRNLAAASDAERVGELAGDAVHGLLERERLQLADPARQQVAGVARAAELCDVRAGVAGADVDARVRQDRGDAVRIGMNGVADGELGPEVLVAGEVEHDLGRAWAAAARG